MSTREAEEAQKAPENLASLTDVQNEQTAEDDLAPSKSTVVTDPKARKAPRPEFEVGDTVSTTSNVGGASRRVVCVVTDRQLQRNRWTYKLREVSQILEDPDAWYSESALTWG